MLSRQMKFSLLFGSLAVAIGSYAIFAMPHDREVKNLGVFIFKLLPFCMAALSISLLDPSIIRRMHLSVLLIFVCFSAYFFFYVPKMFYEVFFNEAAQLYYMTLLMVPVIILSLALAFRLGGGSSGTTLRIAFGLLVLMLSGLEDLAFLTVNPHAPGDWSPIPEVWDWASHITVRLGHPASKLEAYIFIAFHIGLAIFIALYPFRFLARLKVFLGIEQSENHTIL